MIPSIEFGGSGLPLHFTHANGYTPAAYTPLIETLTPRYRVFSMLLRPLWPQHAQGPNGVKDWSPLAGDLIAFLDQRGEKNVIGVGHSIGGVITLLAALRRPELFRAVVMIDPVLFPPGFLLVWTVIDRLGLTPHIHPLIPTTLRRQRVFESVDAMYDSYRRKAVFSRIDDRNLRTCIEALVRPRPDGQVELIYSPEWEARLYLVGPQVDWQLWKELRTLRPPMLIVRGRKIERGWPDATNTVQQRLPHTEIHRVDGAGHLVPLERPREVGEVIESFLQKVAASETEHRNIPVG
jgi:pimeloyl-ACP methyl ester carboxylesterase